MIEREEGAEAMDAWCADRIDKLLTGMETYIMSGGKTNDPNYRQQLGQHQAYSAMRSLNRAETRAQPHPGPDQRRKGLFVMAEPTNSASRKTYAIADLHGRFDLLCKAIDAVEARSPNGGKLIIMGDFVDRGPQSRSIIDLLMAGPQLPGWEWIVLQGNHEAMMIEVLDNPNPHLMRWWVGNGGGQTLQSYGYQQGDTVLPLKVPPEHLVWLNGLPLWHEDAHRIFVHAGVPFDQPLTEARKDTLQWMLYPGDVEHGDAEFHADEQHCSGKHIVHGHHQAASHPLLKAHRTNLDSFAWNTGRLAIGVFDDTTAPPLEILWAISS